MEAAEAGIHAIAAFRELRFSESLNVGTGRFRLFVTMTSYLGVAPRVRQRRRFLNVCFGDFDPMCTMAELRLLRFQSGRTERRLQSARTSRPGR